MYAVYHGGVIGNGETSVLFFYAAGCATCQEFDQKLTMWYGTTGFPLNVYKVDADMETALTSRYGVTSQRTFVKINASGDAVKMLINPSDASLKAFLQS